MRKVTKQAVNAFMNSSAGTFNNTVIEVLPNVTIMKLHNNPIAYRYNNPEHTLSITNAGWFSNTTKERLNGLPNVSISQRAGFWYLNGNVWDGKLIDIK